MIKKIENEILNQRLGYIEVFLGAAMWSFIGVFLNEMSARGISEEMATCTRFVLAFLFSLIFTISRYGIKSLIISKNDLFRYIAYTLICGVCSTIFYTYAVVFAGVAMAAVVLNTGPVFGAITSRLFYGEKQNREKLTGICINIIGCVIAVTGGRFSFESLSPKGIIIAVLAAFFYGITPTGIKLTL